MKYINLLILVLLLSSCKPISKVVDVFTSAILEPVSLKTSISPDLGEFSVGDPEVSLLITITNNSSDPITKMNLDIGTRKTTLYFAPDPSLVSASPGDQGSCLSSLRPYENCTYKISFNPRKAGTYNLPVTFFYENLIKPETKTLQISALVGEPASLTFTNDFSRFDLGVIEQTDLTEKTLVLEIKNAGALSAKEITYELINDVPSKLAYRLVSNECPSSLKSAQSCKMTIGYHAVNNNYSDPETKFTGKIIMKYIKDTAGKADKLSGFFSFLGSTIEAKFNTNAPNLTFGTLVAGNVLKKTVKITNTGYNSGILKSLSLSLSNGSVFATCVKAASGLALNCNKTLNQFPFVIDDVNSCLGTEVKGTVGQILGDSCLFDISYWPSRGSVTNSTFNTSKISLTFDSRWQNNENIITKNNFFAIDKANTTAAGKLSLFDIMVASSILPANKISKLSDSLAEANLGRLAKISSPVFSTFYKVTVKNTGGSPLSFKKITDGANNFITTSGKDLTRYYVSIKSASCMTLAINALCNISFSLTPIAQESLELEKSYLYDDTSDDNHKFKKFIFTYSDGSTIEDNGSIAAAALLEVRLVSELVSKGKLAIVDESGNLISNITVPPIVNGTSIDKHIYLKNIGEGPIHAIAHDAKKTFIPKAATALTWPFQVKALGTIPLPATKDCFKILYASTPPSSETPDSSRYLYKGESCALAIEVKASEAQRQLTNYYTTALDFERMFATEAINASTTTDMWDRISYSPGISTFAFPYYDGDVNISDAASSNLGYLENSSDLTMSASFVAPAKIVLRDPRPTTSAVIARPKITYKQLDYSYPKIGSLLSYTSNINTNSYFDSRYFGALASGLTSSSLAINHVKLLGLPLANDEIIFHMGTFEVNTNNYADFNFVNKGGASALNVSLTELAGDGAITKNKWNNNVALAGNLIAANAIIPLSLKFSPTIAGLFKRCYNLQYVNQIGNTWNVKVCAIGEAIPSANTPKFKIEYLDYAVAYNTSTGLVQESLGSTWNLLTSRVNVPLNTAADTTAVAIFNTIKGSNLYAKKRLRFTNIGSAAATKINLNFLSSSLAPTALNFEVNYTTSCPANGTIISGNSCTVDIKYKPGANSTNSTYYLAITYDLLNAGNQYISQTSSVLKFTGDSPAKLTASVLGASSENISSWRNSASPFDVQGSWPINIGNYAVNDSHMVTTSVPTTKIIKDIPVVNPSAYKASFLKLATPASVGNYVDYDTTLVSSSDVIIKAKRGCFYGNDEGTSVSADKQGFNSLTPAEKKCFLQVEFKGDYTFQTCTKTSKTKTVILGGQIQAGCNPFVYTLPYYNYERSASDNLYLHMKGFIEPNRSTPDSTNYSNVFSEGTSSSTGTVRFSWPNIDASEPSFGSVIKYRVYYSKSPNELRNTNLFYNFATTPVMKYVDSDSNSIEIFGLEANNYYYFRVATIRSYTHPLWGPLTYISMATTLPILTIPVVPANVYYHEPLKVLIDKNYLNSGERSKGIADCSNASNAYKLTISGTAKNINKSLINTAIWNVLAITPDASDSYHNNDVGLLPHWLSDPTYNMSTNISLYDGSTLPGYPSYNPFKLYGNDSTNGVIYSKECTNNASCDNLYKVVGGDGDDIFYHGTYYTTNSGIPAYFRCYAIMPCPTNTSKLITDVSCAKP